MAKWRITGTVRVTYRVDAVVEADTLDDACDRVAESPDDYSYSDDPDADMDGQPADDAARAIADKPEWWTPWFGNDLVRADEANGRHYVTDGAAIVVLDALPVEWTPIVGLTKAEAMQAMLDATRDPAVDPGMHIKPCYARLAKLAGADRYVVWMFRPDARCAVFYRAGTACAMVMECRQGSSETIPVEQWRWEEVARG